MTSPIFQVDAFCDKPFSGNPAAICLLTDPRDGQWMQNVAMEMNLSETAFVRKLGDNFELRWFTPKIEVDLCGHATLASAHVLWQENVVAAGKTIDFETRSGLLSASRSDDLIELDFPLTPIEQCDAPEGLLDALGITAAYVGKSQFDYLIEVDNEETLRGMRPNFSGLAKVKTRGVIVTCKSSSSEYDFSSRFFAPAAGIDEDPVTGSAHCCLGDFWRKRLGKSKFNAYQASARGGVVRVRVEGDRTFLGGQAITVLKGQLCDDVS